MHLYVWVRRINAVRRTLQCRTLHLALYDLWRARSGCQGLPMPVPSRPVQPASYNGVPCWLLAAEQLTNDYLGHKCFGLAAEGVLVGFVPSGRGEKALALGTTTSFTCIRVPGSKQLLIARDLPDDASGSALALGTYLITTATGSAYDLAIGNGGSTLTRHPREFDVHPSVDGLVPSDLRRDSEALTVEQIVHLEVGSPAVFILDLRRDGVSTIRTTSPVLAIERIECRE